MNANNSNEKKPFAKVYLVENGVQQLFFQTKWQPEKSKPFALFVGGISPRKGIQDLVEAFRDPKLSSSELLMIVGGEGVWSVNLQKSALRNIRWLGRKKAEETAILMAQAWWLVLPTRADTIPNVVKEARLVGLPVITTRSGGQAIYLRDGEDGYFVDGEEVNELFKKAQADVGIFAEGKEMGEKGKKRYENLFLVKDTSENLSKLYKILKRKDS